MMRNNTTSSSSNNNNNNRIRVVNYVSSNSSSSRSYSSNSNSSSTSVLPQNHRRTMEEVWRDLSIQPPPPSLRAMVFQDFLAAGPSKQPITNHDQIHHINHDLQGFPLPPTALSLNSSSSHHHQQQQLQNQQVNDISVVPAAAFFDAINIGSPPPEVGLFSFCPTNKRDLESSSGDRRHKRMMKNRESAARSRARKQAYTNELELEVAHLVAENEKLKKQYELTTAMVAQHSTKKTLQRTSSALF